MQRSPFRCCYAKVFFRRFRPNQPGKFAVMTAGLLVEVLPFRDYLLILTCFSRNPEP